MPYTKSFNEMKLQLKVKDQSEQGNSLGTTPAFYTTTRASPAPSLSTRCGPAWGAAGTQISLTSPLTQTTSTGQIEL